MRFLLATATTVLAVALSTVSAFAQSTTRIETRPYYGYVVSVDKGVRVWRALPPHDRVIINPEGKTPLTLSFNEHRHTSHNSHDHTYRSTGDRGDRAADPSATAPGYFYSQGRKPQRYHSGYYRPAPAKSAPRGH